MTKIEKQTIGVLVIMLVLFIFVTCGVLASIEEAGGIKGIITDITKDVKDIVNEVSEN